MDKSIEGNVIGRRGKEGRGCEEGAVVGRNLGTCIVFKIGECVVSVVGRVWR
jgi:hypothetical protein